MNLNRIQPVVMAVAFVAALLAGCDTGRAGMYKVSFGPPGHIGAMPSVRQSDEERLKQIVRSALAGKGFSEHPGRPHLWNKRGAWVEVYRDQDGQLILKVRAFGSKHDVRVSERTEQELLSLLKQHAEVEVRPVPPPKPPIN
jgi:hypothetical protein